MFCLNNNAAPKKEVSTILNYWVENTDPGATMLWLTVDGTMGLNLIAQCAKNNSLTENENKTFYFKISPNVSCSSSWAKDAYCQTGDLAAF